MLANLKYLYFGGEALKKRDQSVIIVEKDINTFIPAVFYLLPDELLIIVEVFMRTIVDLALLFRQVIRGVIRDVQSPKVIERPVEVKISARARSYNMHLVSLFFCGMRKKAEKDRLPHYRIVYV